MPTGVQVQVLSWALSALRLTAMSHADSVAVVVQITHWCIDDVSSRTCAGAQNAGASPADGPHVLG